jgi:hypothetical protein
MASSAVKADFAGGEVLFAGGTDWAMVSCARVGGTRREALLDCLAGWLMEGVGVAAVRRASRRRTGCGCGRPATARCCFICSLLLTCHSSAVLAVRRETHRCGGCGGRWPRLCLVADHDLHFFSSFLSGGSLHDPPHPRCSKSWSARRSTPTSCSPTGSRACWCVLTAVAVVAVAVGCGRPRSSSTSVRCLCGTCCWHLNHLHHHLHHTQDVKVAFVAGGSAAVHCIVGDVNGVCYTW